MQERFAAMTANAIRKWLPDFKAETPMEYEDYLITSGVIIDLSGWNAAVSAQKATLDEAGLGVVEAVSTLATGRTDSMLLMSGLRTVLVGPDSPRIDGMTLDRWKGQIGQRLALVVGRSLVYLSAAEVAKGIWGADRLWDQAMKNVAAQVLQEASNDDGSVTVLFGEGADLMACKRAEEGNSTAAVFSTQMAAVLKDRLSDDEARRGVGEFLWDVVEQIETDHKMEPAIVSGVQGVLIDGNVCALPRVAKSNTGATQERKILVMLPVRVPTDEEVVLFQSDSSVALVAGFAIGDQIVPATKDEIGLSDETAVHFSDGVFYDNAFKSTLAWFQSGQGRGLQPERVGCGILVRGEGAASYVISGASILSDDSRTVLVDANTALQWHASDDPDGRMYDLAAQLMGESEDPWPQEVWRMKLGRPVGTEPFGGSQKGSV